MNFTKNKIIECLNNKKINISPLDSENIQCNSYDFTLDDGYRYVNNDGEFLDTKKDLLTTFDTITNEGLILKPGIIYLMSTREKFELSEDVEAFVDGRSTTARFGIITHLTSGNIKPGFKGKITLEVTCINPVKIYRWQKLGQVMFSYVEGTPSPYSGKYQNQYTAQAPILKGEHI